MPHLMDERIKIVMAWDYERTHGRNECVIEACEIALRLIDAQGITSHIEKTDPDYISAGGMSYNKTFGITAPKECGTCYGHGLWSTGDHSPMGSMDAKDGFTTIACPECGANRNRRDG